MLIAQTIMSGISSAFLVTAMENLPTSPLTPKEIEVLELAAQGLTDSEISKALNTSQLNIRDRLSSAKDKFAAKNMLQLIAMAMSKGLIEYKQPL